MNITPMLYTLHVSMEVNTDTINEGALLCDAKDTGPSQENLHWYFETEIGSIYITVSLK